MLRRHSLFGIVCISMSSTILNAATATWNLDANGNWNVNGNWTPATFPNNIDDTANFFNIITANRTITLGQNITIGTMILDSTSNYIVSGADTLTFGVSAGNAALNLTGMNSGAGTISCPSVLSNNLTMTHSSTADLTISGAISGSGSLTKSGAGTGFLVLSGANSYTGGTNLSDGKLRYSANGAFPAGSTVTVGDGSGAASSAVLTMAVVMTQPNAFNATLNSDGSIVQNSGSTVFLSPLQGSGLVTLSSGTTNANLFNITNNSTTTFSGTISGGAASSGPSPVLNNRFYKAGTGTLILSGANTYLSRSFIGEGILVAQDSNALGVSGFNSSTYVLGGTTTTGSLYLENNINLPKRIALNGVGVASTGALRNVSGDNTISGEVRIGWTGGAEMPADATIQVDSGSSLTLSGPLLGTTNLTKTGSGPLIISGGSSNLITGTIIINEGVVRLNKNAGIQATAGNFVINGGTLTIDALNQISDNAAVTISSGTFDMNGFSETINDLFFYGGTLTQGGGILASVRFRMRDTTINGNIQGLFGGFITFENTNNGTAVINGSIDLTMGFTAFAIDKGTAAIDMLITGPISGDSGFTKSGLGTLAVTGANTYSGVTVISQGTLQGNTTSLQGNIDIHNDSVLIFDQTANGTYAGMISGGVGSLIKQGGGTLTLSNTNSVAGPVTISSGALCVNGSLEGGGVITVASGATLKGTGTVTKDTTVLGTLSPGNSIGTIHLVGAQTLASGSTLEIELNPTANDLVDVTGSFTIQPGSTLAVLSTPGTYSVPLTYTIVQTTGGVSGTFSSVTSTLPPLIATDILYTPFEVLLQLNARTLSSFNFHGNAKEVAQCLDALSSSSCCDFSQVNNVLRNLPTVEEIEEALLQMEPSAFTSLAVAQENNLLYMRSSLYQRLEKQIFSPSRHQREPERALWISPFGAGTAQKSHRKESGFTAKSPGFSIGMDALVAHRCYIGGAIGYASTHLHWRRSLGHAHMQTVYTALYGRWRTARAYLEGSLIGGGSLYSVDREIKFGTLLKVNRRAKSRHQSLEGSMSLKYGLHWNIEGTILAPFANIDYLLLHENQFKEKGAGCLNLKIKSKNSDLLSSEAGIHFSHCYPWNSYSFTPFFQLSIIRESRFKGEEEKASFNCGCHFKVHGLYPSRTLGSVKAGLDLFLPSSTLSFFYQGKYSRTYRDHSIYLQYQLAF
jgi:autotransporter-associated beta strand protein